MIRRETAPRYRSFLLRCWQTSGQHPAERSSWRFRLVDVETRQERGFADLEALMVFLQGEMETGGESIAGQGAQTKPPGLTYDNGG